MLKNIANFGRIYIRPPSLATNTAPEALITQIVVRKKFFPEKGDSS
jgi:hypothetical protein